MANTSKKHKGSRPAAPDRRDANINVRISKTDRDLIYRAADAVGKSRSEFVIESARQHAVDVLLDRRFFLLNEADYATFLEVLDNPPAPNKALKALMAEKPLWEK